MRDIIRQKLGQAREAEFPPLTAREAQLPDAPGKAHAIIGMRRAGKTYFLYQCLAARLAAGVPRERLVYFNFEDERLGDLRAEDLGLVVEEYYRQWPALRGHERVTFAFDEIQVVSGWERFARRVLDEERVELLLSGSSARLLSREVATSMRGRALETVITPFSFREFLRHRGAATPAGDLPLGPQSRSRLEAAFDDYVATGGFPEAQAIGDARTRVRLLQGYVDAVLFRDVVERYRVSNVTALRALVRQLLRNPAGLFSVSKLTQDFHSRGIAASKETLLQMVNYLEDAFLIASAPVASRSERRQQVNPRKLYLADHSLAAAFSPVANADRGHYLENIVAVELQRRGWPVAYYRTKAGAEVDFLTRDSSGRELLIQVTADVSTALVWEREARALSEAAAERRGARLMVLTEIAEERAVTIDGGRTVRIVPIIRWLLEPLTATKE